jgi:hypothetical protein
VVFFLTICGRTPATGVVAGTAAAERAPGAGGATFMVPVLMCSWASDAGRAVLWCLGLADAKKSD